MKCERVRCLCGNKEIRDPQSIVIGGVRVPVPYCKEALALMKQELESHPDAAQYKYRNPKKSS